MRRLGFFFGAGAEISYGLPSGGRFAVEIFRQNTETQKERLRLILNNIDRATAYATDWLPENFHRKRIHAFGKSEFTNLIESSIEYRKAKIKHFLNDFDNRFLAAAQTLGVNAETLRSLFQSLTQTELGSRRYSQLIRMNPALSDNVQLFNSEYYSAILDLLRHSEDAIDLRRFASSFLQLLVASYGQDLIQRLNQDIFTEAPDDLPIFDDITGMFRMELSKAGLSALELLLEEKRDYALDECIPLFSAISQQILEDLFSEVLDYQSLIDSHFRYLYSPKTEWAKFTKMVIFLYLVREYIQNKAQLSDDDLQQKEGYYHDLVNLGSLSAEISVIGTANYNNLAERVLSLLNVTGPDVFHLNGSVNDYYDPFKNKTVSFQDSEDIPDDWIYVPFILTQSGLKPLTSIGMSQRYVQLYQAYKDSDAIVSIGYGFNADDGHINGIFRELIEELNKTLFIVAPESSGTEADIKKDIAQKLRVTKNRDNIVIVRVNKHTRLQGDKLWLNVVDEALEGFSV